MISSISLRAFKSLPNKTISISSLTVLSGLNNSGKSSIIQAIRMYDLAAKGGSPLLEGHGSISEIRSKFSTKDEPIEVIVEAVDKGKHTLTLSEGACTHPSFSPVFSYIGAGRLGPQTVLPLRRSIEELPYIGEKGEFVFDFMQKMGDAIIPEKLRHPESQGVTLAFELAGWLSEIAPGVVIELSTDHKADFARAEYDSFRPANVGFGLSYTLPILTAVLGMAASAPSAGWEEGWGDRWEQQRSSNGTLLVVENPEAHLHPQGQTAMGRLLALAASCGVQIVTETHSDHLIDGIRIAVKESLIKAEDVSLHFLSKSKEGLSEIVSPTINDSGKLDYWPDGFFDQTLKNRATLARRN